MPTFDQPQRRQIVSGLERRGPAAPEQRWSPFKPVGEAHANHMRNGKRGVWDPAKKKVVFPDEKEAAE